MRCKLLVTALDFPCSLSSLGNGLKCRKYLEVYRHTMHRAYFFIIWIFIIPFSLFIWSKQPSIAPSRQNNSLSLSAPELPYVGINSGFATDLGDLIRESLNDGVQAWFLKRYLQFMLDFVKIKYAERGNMFTETRVPKDVSQGACFWSSLPAAINKALPPREAQSPSSSVLDEPTAEELLILLHLLQQKQQWP